MTFWNYYSTFQGPRSFYWINRSFWKKDEVSLLYFDIEWYSESEDPTANERLAIIKQAITSSLPRKCQFINERLSRPDKKWGWKNSWHIYADVTLEHNAQGCMHSLVVNQIWFRIKDEPLMWCSTTTKPILDMRVYTKNRCWRVPGSTKWPDHSGRNLPLPSMEMFLQTRMAERPGPPTWNTNDLNIWNCSKLPQINHTIPNKTDTHHNKNQPIRMRTSTIN